MSTETAEKAATEQEVKAPLFVVDIDETEVAAVKTAVLEANQGKTEIELAKEIEAATAARLQAKQAEAAPFIAKMEELSKDETNKGKTEEELSQMAAELLAKETPANPDEDLDKYLFGGGAPTAAASTDPAKPAASTVDLPADIKEKVAKYEEIQNDIVYKALLNARANNASFDLVDLVIESGLTYNPEKITDPVLFKRQELAEMRKEDPSITDEDVEEFLEDFKAKSKIAQWNEVKGIKEAMVSQYRAAKSHFATKVASGVEASKESSKLVVAEAEQVLKSYDGQKFFGVDITEAQKQKVVNAIATGTVVVKGADGKVDVAKTAEAVLLMEGRYDIAKSYYERGKRDAQQKDINRKSNPLNGLRIRSAQTQAAVPNAKEKLAAAKKALRPDLVQ